MSSVAIDCSYTDVCYDEAHIYLHVISTNLLRCLPDKTLSHILEQICDMNQMVGLSPIKRIKKLFTFLQCSELCDRALSLALLKAAICSYDNVHVEPDSELATYMIIKACKMCAKYGVKINAYHDTIIALTSHPRMVKNIVTMLEHIISGWDTEKHNSIRQSMQQIFVT